MGREEKGRKRKRKRKGKEKKGGREGRRGEERKGERRCEDLLLFFFYLLLSFLLIYLPDAVDALGLQGFSQLPLLLLFLLGVCFGFSLLDSKTLLKKIVIDE